jgi:hypothetical protein
MQKTPEFVCWLESENVKLVNYAGALPMHIGIERVPLQKR